MKKHLLVTNDFPPKIGGIQNYLFEIWRRLDPSSFVVLTTASLDAQDFDSQQEFEIVRLAKQVLLPSHTLAKVIRNIARQHDVDYIIWDPALPVGRLANKIDLPYGLILHGAELTVPAKLPLASSVLRKIINNAKFIIAAGQYPKSELEQFAERSQFELPLIFEIPPGVDSSRYKVLADVDRASYRHSLGITDDEFLVSSVSRLVPRKGMDTLIKASALLSSAHPELKVVIAGTGRDDKRLNRLIRKLKAPVTLIGEIKEEELPMLMGSSDVFAMLCRSRWGGLEQEGFGIVFVEASSCAVPVIAGFSGGSCEAVVHEETGIVVYKPKSQHKAAEAISMLITSEELRHAMGKKGRSRVVDCFTYDVLSKRLSDSLATID